MAADTAPKPDAIDEQILDELRKEPRATSKALGLKLSMTEVSIAARIRAMEAKGIMRVVAQLDFRALGYNVLALVDVTVSNREIHDVAGALAKLDGVGSVTIMLGDPSIILQVQASNLGDLQHLLMNEIATISGVEQVETNVIIDIAKWRPGSAQLHPIAGGGSAVVQMQPSSPDALLDDVDRAIVLELQKNGRNSNREVGRILGVSEGTIRQRLKKLETAKAMRLGLITDAAASDQTSAAFVRIKAQPSQARAIGAAIAESATSSFVGLTMGRFDLVALLTTTSREELVQAIDGEIALMKGVLRLDVREPVGYAKHRFDLVHIP